MDHGPNPTCCLLLLIRFYWDNSQAVVCGCLHSIKAELSSCTRDPVALRTPNIYSLALYRERLLTPGLARCIPGGADVGWTSLPPTGSGSILCSVEPRAGPFCRLSEVQCSIQDCPPSEGTSSSITDPPSATHGPPGLMCRYQTLPVRILACSSVTPQ